ncbi:hypothetical protein [Seramator thermalis]|jgi:hypothetical protein|nr:hypothetical protein [Seramator thermalis]MDK2968913.1 hypothetical protein [Bacteroidota bacterium]OPZ14524.1 MAG: hypothetical protein BWZ06_00930 [Bacteroidetes bacterium ADurb.BinA261]
MDIKNLTKEEILSQIKYLERNIFNGSVVHRMYKINRLRELKSCLQH